MIRFCVSIVVGGPRDFSLPDAALDCVVCAAFEANHTNKKDLEKRKEKEEKCEKIFAIFFRGLKNIFFRGFLFCIIVSLTSPLEHDCQLKSHRLLADLYQ